MRQPILAPPHTVESSGIGPLGNAIEHAGIPLGTLASGEPVLTRLFSGAGRQVVSVGNPLAVMLALRAIQARATVHVSLKNRTPWQRVLEHEGGELARHLRIDDNSDISSSTVASFVHPVLRVVDVPAAGSPGSPLSAWSSRVMVIHRLDTMALPTLRSADLVLTGTLTRDQAIAACPILRLPSEAIEVLSNLPPTTIAAVAEGEILQVSVQPTQWEWRLLQAAGS